MHQEFIAMNSSFSREITTKGVNRLSQAWLQAASDDLDVIKQILSQPHLIHLVVFHSQQAIEKTFKALISQLIY
ncbi:MAG: HEPN domain-containing protein [Sulfuricurvum sp.]|nr:HEPN domain-containing protein [Sulfuricurvum sp.]